MTPADRLRSLVNEATLGPWETRSGEGAGVWAHGRRRLEQGSYGTAADLSLAALAPQLAELVADMAEALELIAGDPEFEEWTMKSQRTKARTALADFAALFPEDSA